MKLYLFVQKEKRRLSRGEVTLNIPPVKTENGRRMSRHDALAHQTSSDDNSKNISTKRKIIIILFIELNQSPIFSSSNNIIYYFIFMYEKQNYFFAF